MSSRRSPRRAVVAAVLALAAARCGPPPPDYVPPDPGPEPGLQLFRDDALMEVRLEMTPQAWDQVRFQSRDLPAQLATPTCMAQPFPSPWFYVEATRITVNGVALERVGVRKKGFLGSLASDRPSLKVSFDEYVPGQKIDGLKGITLNNAKQDPSYLRTCLAYRVFRIAGVPAPRCSFARVNVNGADLGLYVHVEPVGKPLLRRHFDDVTGNLYEGTISDFRPGYTGTFDLKTNELVNDRSRLEALATAAAAPDASLLSELARYVDLDAYFTFWAAEVLTNHWDGYDSNNNNYFVYDDPATGKFRFLPWGPDGAFVAQSPFPAHQQGPVSAMARSQLSYRLFQLPEGRTRYIARLRELLASAWKENELLVELERMNQLIAPVAQLRDPQGYQNAVEQVRQFIRNRRATLTAELDSGSFPAVPPLRTSSCLTVIGQVSGSFTTTWGTNGSLNPYATGSGTFNLTLNGVAQTFTAVGATAGLDGNSGKPVINLVGRHTDGSTHILNMSIELPRFTPGATIPSDLSSSFNLLIRWQGFSITVPGIGGSGSIHLDEASMATGGPVRGTISADVITSPF
jgi:hypothetical protein